MPPLEEFLNTYRQLTDQQLQQALNRYGASTRLQKAMHYGLFNGGKRIRPALIYASACTIAEPTCLSDQAAMAIEAIHAYSLLHDDLPAMDDDDLRRGQPTCHIAFDEATAILAGDALQAFAFESLTTDPQYQAQTRLKMLQILARAAGAAGMVAGQSLDLQMTGQHPDLGALETMHGLKTGALITASVQMGALSSTQASNEQLSQLTDYAKAIGLAFQVQDDILDVTADTQTLGKPQGADIAREQPTYVSLLGLCGAQTKLTQLHQHALDALTSFGPSADRLRELANYIVERSH